MMVVLVGSAFGAMLVGQGGDIEQSAPVAFVGQEALVEVELHVGDFEDLGDEPSR